LRHQAGARGEKLRKDAHTTVAAAAEWILQHADEICDIIEAGTPRMPMSRQMLAEAFRNCVGRWTDADDLKSFVKEECAALSSGHPVFPQVIFHNLAGNLFLSGWESIPHAVLLGAASLVRC